MKKYYALSLPLILNLSLSAQQISPVRFRSGDVFFPENINFVRENTSVAPAEIVNGYYVRYLQCGRIPTAAERAIVEAEGVRFIGYVQFGAYVAVLPQDFDLNKLEIMHVRSIMAVQTAWKLAQNLQEQPYGEWAQHGEWLDVNLQLYPHVSIAEGAERCRRLGMKILLEGNQNGFLQLRLKQDQLASVAAQPWVRYLELVPPPSEPDDTRGRSLHRSNALDSDHALGKKYNGEGVSVLVRDDGPLGPHIDYRGRLQNLTDDGGDGVHGDGVGGIFAGAGNLDPTQKGMAAGATVYAIRYTPEFQDQTLPLHLDKNVTITNTSYSNGCNAGYTLAAQTVDQQIFEHPTLMHVFSAGNSNNISNCLSYGAGNQWGNITGGHKMAKNAIATANLNPDATLVNSSSRGPAYDGRLKPDISANGNQQGSTDPGNTYSTFSGTSAAAPGIAGCLAQLTQAYKALHNGEQPESSLLKAAILNTANDLGNPGPDFKFGWGHINGGRALRLLEENRDIEGQVDQGEQSGHVLQIPANIRLARLMLYWADPPAAAEAGKALQNDLDLTVVAPDGTVYYPWKLDPTPNPAILDQPAERGRDSLNNVEQVAIANPAPGIYTVKINGAEVPFGPQHYVLVWEFSGDNIRITYPIGGEGFVPGETERIHWDAEGNQGFFSLRYSTDDGFSWQQIADVTGDRRTFDWQVPNVASGRVRLLLQRGLNIHTTELPLTIAPLPSDIKVEQVCPNSMTISWKPANDTLPGEVYLLGKKYMEIAGTTSGNTFIIPLQNGGGEQWVSVRAHHSTGLTGRRAVAVQWPGELKNCTQPDDLGVRQMVSPAGETAIRCEAFTLPVTVLLKNEGTQPVSGATMYYRVNDDSPVSQTAPNIAPGDSILFTFLKPVSVTENKQLNLKVWSNYAAEDAFFNDTVQHSLMAVAQPLNAYFTENFQGFEYPPPGWRIENPDESLTWTKTAQDVTDANGQPARVLALYHFFYITPDEEDYLYMIPVDLKNIPKPGLTFQYAHAGRTSTADAMRVEVFPACDLTATPVVIWQKNDPELATAGTSNNSFTPNEAGDWQTEMADLQQFENQKILIRFVGVNGAGNNIYLDNIGIAPYTVTPPLAAFTASADSVCLLDTVTFAATPTGGGNFTQYNWNFGTSAQPGTAQGLGPHYVRFFAGGLKSVRLVASNAEGADTVFREVRVLSNPVANFTVQLNGSTATFNNSSQYALSSTWDFGDGNSSHETNPVHTYSAPGTYSVKLTVGNQCRTHSKTLNLPVTTGIGDFDNIFSIRILPNPTAGDFRVEIEGRAAGNDLRLSLFDAQGRLIRATETAIKQERTTVAFENLHLPAGVYQLKLQTERGSRNFTVVVQ